MSPAELLAADPVALRVALAKLATHADPGDVGLVYTEDESFSLLEVATVTAAVALAFAEDAGAVRIARRLRCEAPPRGHLYVVLAVGSGLHLLAIPREARVNAKGGDA